MKVTLFVDNNTVVLGLNDILQQGFCRQDWDSKADIGLWTSVAADIITRPQGFVQVFKVKSHRHADEVSTPFDRWTKAGNDLADPTRDLKIISDFCYLNPNKELKL